MADSVLEYLREEFRRPIMPTLTVLGFLLSALPFLPLSRTRGVVFVHQDLFIAYAPGEVVGIRDKGLPREPGAFSFSTLPDPPFRVVDLDGAPITSPIWDAEVAVWNPGPGTMGGDKLREPLVIRLPNADRMLGVRVLHSDPKDGVQITVRDDKSVSVTWKYMDEGKGFKIAVVHATGSPGLAVIDAYVDGDVENTNISFFSRYKWSVAAVLGAVLLVVSVIAWLIEKRRVPGYVALAMIAGNIGFSIWSVNKIVQITAPPF